MQAKGPKFTITEVFTSMYLYSSKSRFIRLIYVERVSVFDLTIWLIINILIVIDTAVHFAVDNEIHLFSIFYVIFNGITTSSSYQL